MISNAVINLKRKILNYSFQKPSKKSSRKMFADDRKISHSDKDLERVLVKFNKNFDNQKYLNIAQTNNLLRQMIGLKSKGSKKYAALCYNWGSENFQNFRVSVLVGPLFMALCKIQLYSYLHNIWLKC
ncbi:hypothetical protein BpHYR1_029921 [Brachionus plicatilis]|uniref:Uncharacterized protein n=1 Tax=Brachionus plicatilis TaxID=10195 RepID=A0A3M7Q646_BRAPC|nr:hypothetical protein BpHYR1_029921 [Brachionus plicatilis]